MKETVFGQELAAEMPTDVVVLDAIVIANAFDREGKLRIWSSATHGTDIYSARSMLQNALGRVNRRIAELEEDRGGA